MKKLYEESMLFDFYGELLTTHQKVIYEDFVLNDLSLGEIAEDRGISRQGVYDIVKRCRKQLQGYEEKLHLIARFREAKASVSEIRGIADSVLREEPSVPEIRRRCEDICRLSDRTMEVL